ncbi:MAG: hypothetical protein PUD59_05165 [bacterium]|nr:hypothetical protein [bacterium]
MNNNFYDIDYLNIVNDILNNDEFNKLSQIVHHGLDRKNHSIRVSYYSYKLSKLFGFDYISSARAGLLHDFFFENNKNSNIPKKIKTLIKHPEYALENSCKQFYLNDMEKDIIVSHMFPVSIRPPKYIEAWIVNLVDDIIAIMEVAYSARRRISYGFNFLLILMFTYIK